MHDAVKVICDTTLNAQGISTTLAVSVVQALGGMKVRSVKKVFFNLRYKDLVRLTCLKGISATTVHAVIMSYKCTLSIVYVLNA
jgi:hypothetical protein